MTIRRSRNRHLRAMAEENAKRDGAETLEQHATGEDPKHGLRNQGGAGKGDGHRPRFVNNREYARRQWVLWVDCDSCGRQQMRGRETCIRCGARLPKAKILS